MLESEVMTSDLKQLVESQGNTIHFLDEAIARQLSQERTSFRLSAGSLSYRCVSSPAQIVK